LAIRTYDEIGLEVRDILERSDLYPRPGKNQHAFCIDVDREGDIRTLNNLEPNLRWNSTLLHELGHAVYDKYIDRSLPWLLRQPAHTLTTEAIAILMAGLIGNRDWLTSVLGIPMEEAEQLAHRARQRQRASRLIFTRWSLVMTHFERGLYADPQGDLDTLWWDLKERFQRIVRPDGRKAPDWAAKYHIPLAPVYYQNYELGVLVTTQFEAHLKRDVGGLFNHEGAGRWLIEYVFKPGASEVWTKHVESVTGEPLTADYFMEAIS
jgi:peptidyl-dipeptidase A